jgi:hypothetical protein
LAETPTQARAGTEGCAETPGAEKGATFHVPNTGSFGAEAHAVTVTIPTTIPRPTPSLFVTMAFPVPPLSLEAEFTDPTLFVPKINRERATRSERADKAARESACRGVPRGETASVETRMPSGDMHAYFIAENGP